MEDPNQESCNQIDWQKQNPRLSTDCNLNQGNDQHNNPPTSDTRLWLMETDRRTSPHQKYRRALSWKTAALPWEATKALPMVISSGTPPQESWTDSLSAILNPIKNLKGLEIRMRQEIKRACDGSNEQETYEEVSGLQLCDEIRKHLK